MPKHHKRKSGAPAVKNTIKIGTNIILYWVKTKSTSPNLLFSTVVVADVYKKRERNSSKRK